MRYVTQVTLFGFRLAPLLLVAYWLLLFTGTHLPNLSMPKVPNGDKIQHFVAYAGLAFLLCWSIPGRQRTVGMRMTLAFVITAVYGVFDEYTQQFVGRDMDVADFIADCFGAAVGITAYRFARGLLFPGPSRAASRSKRWSTSANAGAPSESQEASGERSAA